MKERTVLASLVEDDALDGADKEHRHAEAAVHPGHVPRYTPCHTQQQLEEYYLNMRVRDSFLFRIEKEFPA